MKWVVLAVLMAAPVAAAPTPLPDASQLARAMARDAGKLRLLIVASPTDNSCRRGVAAVMREVLSLRSAALQLFVVWTPLLDADSREIAQLEARLYPDKRVQHFWDGDGKFSRMLAGVLEVPERAVDVYVLYDKKSKTPTYWMHQLRDVRAAPALDAFKLRAKVEERLK